MKNDFDIIDAQRLVGGASVLARWRAQRGAAASFVRLDDAPMDRRAARRRDLKLHSGKALTCGEAFVSECVVRNRTADGACLKLARNVTPPSSFLYYDDDAGAVYAAQIIWRRGAEIGVRLSRAPLAGKAPLIARMQSRYYAL